MTVTIRLTANVSEVVRFPGDKGGDPRNVGEVYIEAYAPVSLMGRLSEQAGVVRVREIIPAKLEFGPVTSQGVQATWRPLGTTPATRAKFGVAYGRWKTLKAQLALTLLCPSPQLLVAPWGC